MTRAALTSLDQGSGAAPTPGPDSQACVANIGPAERRKRLTGGVVSLALTLLLLAALNAAGVSHWWRITLFVPLAGATFGYFQWRDQTCVAFAARKVRKLGDRAEKVSEAAELLQIEWQARRVEIKAILTAVVLTLIMLALP